jgi:hypothetical protein
MNHDWIENNIIRFIDNDLTDADKSLFMDHLSRCESCNKKYLYVRSIWLLEKDDIEPPRQLWDRISQTLNGSNSETAPFINSVFEFSKKYSLAFLLFLSIFLGTFFGNKILSSNSRSADKVNITEEYYPSGGDVIETNIIGIGR